jgi:putative hemolysin
MREAISAHEFSYAAPDDAPWRRVLIHGVEQLTGKPRLRRMYDDYRRGPAVDDFFAEAVARLNLVVRVYGGVGGIPRTGPLVVVANHPFGVVDGIVLGYLLSRVRPDFRILVHSVLYRLPELRPNLLPIDFSETPQARETNLASRKTALEDLNRGRAIAVFPGGAVSTAPPLAGRAADPEWKPFVGRLIRAAKPAVVPIYFSGQNSRLFQVASGISMTLRASLLFREVVNKIGTEVRAHVGAAIPHGALARFADHRALAAHLRARTYALNPDWTRRARSSLAERPDDLFARLERIAGR